MTPDTITAPQSLREHFGEPLHIAVAVEKPQLDTHHRRFIEHSPFICMASAGADGQPAVSPKGDTPGFVKVLDDVTLLIPDRPGNNKVEGFHNMLENPKVSLIFFIPGIMETLRIHGEAEIVLDTDLLELGKTGSKLPATATLVKVSKAYMHCGKALIRSKLWDPGQHIAEGVIPPFGQVIKDQANAPMTLEQVQGKVDQEYQENLY